MPVLLRLIEEGTLIGAVLLTQGEPDGHRFALEVRGIALVTPMPRLLFGRAKVFDREHGAWKDVAPPMRSYSLDPSYSPRHYVERRVSAALTMMGDGGVLLPIYLPGDRQPVSVPVSFADSPLAVEADAAM